MFGMWVTDPRKEQGRTLICERCSLIIDRDVNASINISKRGRTWLTRSLQEMEKGWSGEAMKQSKDVEQMITRDKIVSNYDIK